MTSTTLTQISVYPIKSTRGINLSSSWIEPWGLAFDRRFLVTDPHGTFITARTEPRLCLIQSTLTASGLKLSAPDMPVLTINYQHFSAHYQRVQVWKDVINAQHCNTAYDRWFSDYLGKPTQLLYFGQQSARNVKNSNSEVAFADGYPLLLISTASLADLNQRTSSAMLMSQFRPNLVVDHCDAFAEDSWRHIRIGEVEFELVKPCSRCIFTTVNPLTAEKHPLQEPLATLKNFRKGSNGDIDFGQNLIALNQGKISVGDNIEILTTQQPRVYPDNAPVLKAKARIKTPTPDIKQSEHAVTTQTQPSAKAQKINIVFATPNVTVQGNNQQTLLEQGEAAGLILPYSCRAGMCGSCKMKLDQGEVEQLANDALSDAEQRQGYILACSCIPKTDVVISASN